MPRCLASDLDGTLIPMEAAPDQVAALKGIAEARMNTNMGLVYATGRHFESVIEAIEEYQMPEPDWIICDVGSAIYRSKSRGFAPFQLYESHLRELSRGIERDVVEGLLACVDGLILQAPDHQQQFKISYESAAHTVSALVETVNGILERERLPFECMGSLDPFLNCGLLDVLPKGVSKAYALLWLSTHADFKPDEVVFSGDSGNDYAALVSGFRAIVVANASEGLADRVEESLTKRNLVDRLYRANGKATSGVLEGCRFYGLIES